MEVPLRFYLTRGKNGFDGMYYYFVAVVDQFAWGFHFSNNLLDSRADESSILKDELRVST